jgi:hypothetical protein
MTESILFMAGLTLTLLVSLAVVYYMNAPLRKLLHELCGNPERAEFWAAFANITVALVPVIFAMDYEPASNWKGVSLVEVGQQLKWGLVGLVISVLMLGWILSRFIPRTREQNAAR